MHCQLQSCLVTKLRILVEAATLQKQDDAQDTKVKDFVFCISSCVFCRTNFEARIHDHNVRWAKFIEFKKDSLFGRLRLTCAVHIFPNFCKLHQNSRWNLAGVSCLTENHVPCDWLCLESLDTANKIHKTLNMHVYDSCCVIVYCMNRLYKWTVTAS